MGGATSSIYTAVTWRFLQCNAGTLTAPILLWVRHTCTCTRTHTHTHTWQFTNHSVPRDRVPPRASTPPVLRVRPWRAGPYGTPQWDKHRFPDVKGMVARAHKMGLRVGWYMVRPCTCPCIVRPAASITALPFGHTWTTYISKVTLAHAVAVPRHTPLHTLYHCAIAPWQPSAGFTASACTTWQGNYQCSGANNQCNKGGRRGVNCTAWDMDGLVKGSVDALVDAGFDSAFSG